MHEICYEEYININVRRGTDSANNYTTGEHFNKEHVDASGLSNSRWCGRDRRCSMKNAVFWMIRRVALVRTDV
jgi:hypothetical protein